ncbi:Nucleic acid-binding, OB-fold [Cinara cedri]|uniref:Nucleic acid-binding, OB-fold n=1 Tax=Cinara cedri TaxID=506608 RepID=A0A5E4MQQ1_9HEMI|nr:Nucleic acid-binding, OB-fold [Cinara cedri]
MATGVMRLKLNSIFPGTTNFLVVGIIIAKLNPKVIISKKDNKETSVFSFTIRDSPEDVVNVSVWGSYDFTKQLYSNFKVGNTVDLINPTIKFKPEIEERYMPKSSSSFFLTLNENTSQMLIHDAEDSINYKHLLRIPTCPQNMYLKIEDIHSSGKEMCGKFCSLLVIVRCVKSTQLIKTKFGKETFLKEIIVLDKTHPTLFIKIWNNELIERATHWIPRKTVLSISDLYLKWDIFKKNMTAAISNRTIITEDPSTNEANDLKNYAITHLIGLSDKFTINIPDLSTITEIMTCKRILINSNERNVQFSTVLYAIVSKFNIDGSSPLFLNKCNICGTDVENAYLMCLNPECTTHFNIANGSDELESILNIKLSLTDISGTLDNCILHHKAATKILCKVTNFQNMSLKQRTELKWKYLFVNCKIKLISTKSTPGEKITFIIVDICNEGPIHTFISQIPIY